ncbi:uncharacterized protein MELLADRAFT_108521 [Melampsora larici-populina 98AG31]|uniref:VPS37 C-terminal domain-containing protein n=1 Tax=Melampsora larici-populina (strain 98AG31 / pathotype 3-4-7) TaxID=747676 RepID=F4RTC9_MELLP|nr:uncharacterized protein MELLADRAFT_108521 [Melampsora larici-populina 98AG31]EGG04365.1 hypothetical protein MELLADRAFT_108521 [Melampsora larici-populina 98AG31]
MNDNNQIMNTNVINDQLSEDFPEISKLSKEDLQDLLKDEEYFNSRFILLNEVKSLFENQSGLIAANEVIAKFIQVYISLIEYDVVEKNLSLKDQLTKVRDETSLAFDHTHSLMKQFQELTKEQNELYLPFGEQSNRSRLLTALHESNQLTENLSSEFVEEGLIEEDVFVKEFKEERIKFYKRSIIVDRWNQGKIKWD